MMRTILTLLAGFAVGLPVGLLAQSPSRTDTLLARLTAEAVATAPAIRRSDAMARAASARIRPAGALPDPMMSAGVMDLTLPNFRFHESDFTEVDVELSQQIPWPGTLGAQTRAAQATALSAAANVSELRREIALRVAMLYYRLRYLVTAQQTLAHQRGLLQTGVEVSTARYGTGSVAQSDPLLARVALARLGAEEAALGAEEAGLRADLKALRGVKRSEQLDIAPIASDSVYTVIAGDSLHAAHLAAARPLETHPRLEAARASLEAARQTVTAEALGGRPDFEFSARYGARPLGSDFFSAFIGIRLPLWAGRKQRRLVEAAQLDAEAAQHALEEDESALGAELERTLAEAQAGELRLNLLVESVLPAAREGVQSVLRGYRVGQTEFLSVLMAEDALYRAELETAQVASEHLTHLVMLELLLGPEESH
ncbi:MAG: TolC family protein [Gemmatimonadota bacterium]